MIQKLCVMKLYMFWNIWNIYVIVSTNVSTNSDGKKVRYKINCYILHAVLVVIILILEIAIICYHFAKDGSKLKTYWRANSIKIENNEF